MKNKILFTLLFTALLLFALDRTTAYIYQPKPDSKEVILYTTDWCPYCNSLRIHLENNDIPYTKRDIEKSISGIAGFWALRARGVPVSVVGPKVVYGYDINKISEQLTSLGYDLKLTE